MTGFMRRFPAASAASAASAAPAAAAAAASFRARRLPGEAARSQPPALPKVVEDSLDRKFNTEADAVILEESRVVTLGKNGEVKERTRIVQKMLTDFGVDEYCDPRILYNAAHQKLTVIEASTFMLDGKKVVTGDNGKNQATPDAMATFPHYCDVQEMIVSHVGVEVGGVTVLEYEIEDRKPWRKFFYGLEPFTEERDIESKVLELRVPAGMKLEWKALHFNPEVVKVPGGEQDVYTFRAGNIKGMNLHEGGGKPAQTLPCLFYSEKMDEKTLSRAVMGSAHGFDGSMSKEEEGKVKDMIKAIDGEIADKMVSPLDRTLYIYRRVADWLGGAAVDRKVFGWSLRPGPEAFASGYADTFEKLGILYSIFSYLGYDPKPLVTLYRPDGPVKNHPDNIAGAWIKISAHGFYLYLPASGSDACGEPRPEKAFVVKPDGLEPASFVKPATARVRIDLGVDLRKAPYAFSATLKFRGKYNPYWKALLGGGSPGAGDIAREALACGALNVEKASFQRLALNETVVLASGTVAAVDGEVDLALPSAMLAAGLESLDLWRQERETPLAIGEKEIESLVITVLLPEKGEVLFRPEPSKSKIHYDFDPPPGGAEKGGVDVSLGSAASGKKLKVKRTVVLHPGVVTPGQYKGLRAVMSEAFAPNLIRTVIAVPED
jgi:hypothetical protein